MNSFLAHIDRPKVEGGLSVADVYIYDAISSSRWDDGVSAKEFAREINALDVDELRVFVNSPGGDAWEGLAIMNALRRHKAFVTATVDALAASAASVIVMGANRVVMNSSAELMIHDPWTFAEGNAGDLEKTVEALNKLADSYATAYANRAGGTVEGWREVMRAETWFSAEEAVIAGLADEWVDAVAAAASAQAFDLSAFKYKGRADAPAPKKGLLASEPEGTSISIEEEHLMSELSDGIRQRLGIADSVVDDAEILAALDERLAGEQASSKPVIPEGMRLVEDGVLDQMRADAAKGREAFAIMEAKRRDEIVAKAVAEGRITPASKERMRALLDSDEESTLALIESLVPNTVPVGEVGIGEESEPKSAADKAYEAAWGPRAEKEA